MLDFLSFAKFAGNPEALKGVENFGEELLSLLRDMSSDISAIRDLLEEQAHDNLGR